MGSNGFKATEYTGDGAHRASRAPDSAGAVPVPSEGQGDGVVRARSRAFWARHIHPAPGAARSTESYPGELQSTRGYRQNGGDG